MIKRLLLLGVAILAAGLAGCGDSRSHAQAVYVLIDTSGTYAQEAAKAQLIVNYLLGTLQPGDSLAVARVESRSFTEKDIIAKATFDQRPSQANAQKRAFREATDNFLRNVKSSRHTDITGGLLQGAEFLNETGAGTKTIVVFSDMQEGARQDHGAQHPDEPEEDPGGRCQRGEAQHGQHRSAPLLRAAGGLGAPRGERRRLRVAGDQRPRAAGRHLLPKLVSNCDSSPGAGAFNIRTLTTWRRSP